jgi:cytoskeletal protein CcmA (bactofilin family)
MDRAESGLVIIGDRSIGADIRNPLLETLVGRACTIDGEIACEHDLRIEGTVHGRVECKGVLRVEAGARVLAEISAANVVISGYVEGHIACSGRAEIRRSGEVMGEMGTGTLVIEEGAAFDGEVHMAKAAPTNLAVDGPESRQAPSSENSPARP